MPTTYAIPNGRTVMDATLFTGTGSAQTITNQFGFKPDLVWQKARSQVYAGGLVDSVRGANQIIYSSLTNAEATATNAVNSFNSNGFTGGGDAIATSTNTVVAWQWQAGQGSNTTNTTGTITATVSANANAGFSIVTYTGGGSNGTVGHGLGVAPKMVIVKSRSGTFNWVVYHASLTSASYYLSLNQTIAQTSASTVWDGTAPTSTVFSVGTDNSVSQNGTTYVAYCWAQVAGFSQFGSYTGNGSADGPFIYTGFRPKFLMVKRTNDTSNWIMMDSSRNTYNIVTQDLYADLTAAEDANSLLDFVSNGFKIRYAGGTGINANGSTFVYMAWAENPFKYANAR